MLALEVVLYVAAFAAYVWFVMPVKPAGSGWWRIALACLLAVAPMLVNLLHGDRPADSGLRLDNVRASARLVVPATLVLAAAIVVMGFVMHGWEWVSWRRLAERGGGYLAWGIMQQYLLQSFAIRRLRQANLPPVLAIILAAVLFGLVHAPNWWLVGGTTIAGLVWCSIFIRVPNIFTLGLAQAVLAVLLYHAWAVQTHGLTIGPMFWRQR